MARGFAEQIAEGVRVSVQNVSEKIVAQASLAPGRHLQGQVAGARIANGKGQFCPLLLRNEHGNPVLTQVEEQLRRRRVMQVNPRPPFRM